MDTIDNMTMYLPEKENLPTEYNSGSPLYFRKIEGERDYLNVTNEKTCESICRENDAMSSSGSNMTDDYQEDNFFLTLPSQPQHNIHEDVVFLRKEGFHTEKTSPHSSFPSSLSISKSKLSCTYTNTNTSDKNCVNTLKPKMKSYQPLTLDSAAKFKSRSKKRKNVGITLSPIQVPRHVSPQTNLLSLRLC